MITPQDEAPKLAKALGLSVPLYLKREDLHPYGSHKGRSIPYMIEQYAKGGETRFAISSSGNAALAAARYINEYNSKFNERELSLQIFVGENISGEKFEILKHEILNNPKIQITKCEKPKQSVHILNKKGEAKALRQSNDPTALVGYGSLIAELAEIDNIAAVFVPTSSGTTAEALAEKFRVEIVQTSKCHPIAEQFDTNFTPATESSADAIVDIVALRGDSLVRKIKEKNGAGWVVSNEEVKNAQDLLAKIEGAEGSPNGVLGIAGLGKSLAMGKTYSGPVVCIVTGR
ncbi:MAG TPA: PLP-dependent lyase/thiolase [Candidatus Paceibacterota bacterium]